MIPEKLQLRNFMSYRDTVPMLDFAGIHVACLSGENGAGKSALLEAMTWALWGKSRVSSDDELIAQGEHEMEVDFQFGLNGASYRVLRRRSSAKRGQTILDLQVAEAGSWRTLSGNTVRETQALIIDLLRMEYDTFINSAFLVQGKADEFTRKAPAERKRVLVEILGLDAYERLEARAKERQRQLDDQARGKSALIEEYRRHVERREFLIGEELIYRTRVEELQAAAAALATSSAAIQADLQNLSEQRKDRDRQLARMAQLAQTLQADRIEQLALQEQLAVARATVERSAEIEAGGRELAAAQAEVARLDALLDQAYQIRDQRRAAAMLIAQEEQRLKDQLGRLEADAARLRQRIAQRDSLAAERADLHAQLSAFDALEADLEIARQQRETLELTSRALAEVQIERERLLGQIAVASDSLLATREEQKRRIADYDAVLRNETRWREERDSKMAEQRTLLREERQLSEARARDQQETQRLGELNALTIALKDQRDAIDHKLDLLRQSSDTTCPVCQSQIGPSGIEQIEASYSDERRQLGEQWKLADTERRTLQPELEALRREIYRLERGAETQKTITASLARLDSDLRDVDEQRKRHAEASATLLDLETRLEHGEFAPVERAALAQAEERLAAFGIEAAALEQQRTVVAGTIRSLEQQLAQRGARSTRAAVVDEQLGQIDQATTDLVALETDYLSVKQRLDLDEFAADQRAEVQRLNEAMNTLGYGKNAHAEARERVAALAHWAAEQQALRESQVRLDGDQRHLERLSQVLVAHEAEHAELHATSTILTTAIQRLPAVAAEAEQLRTRLATNQTQLAISQQEWGAAQEKVIQVAQIAEQLQVQEAALSSLLEERDVYAELTRAFGKKGIQAMLIETAIPELEREANALLGRMTDHQMHVRFETMRETKKGDTSETLDIQISDAQGTRRYDLYSGGEAFRINFAIRIALSKLLARRAGASLQTLIIDEGFGSQDGQGRERLVEAINSIQSEFQRILVITHIQELKDLFPMQIEIAKTPLGSRWSLS